AAAASAQAIAVDAPASPGAAVDVEPGAAGSVGDALTRLARQLTTDEPSVAPQTPPPPVADSEARPLGAVAPAGAQLASTGVAGDAGGSGLLGTLGSLGLVLGLILAGRWA